MTDDERGELWAEIVCPALQFAETYACIDGEHHKQWVIDQMVRALCGDAFYRSWVEDYNRDPDYADWDEGIAP